MDEAAIGINMIRLGMYTPSLSFDFSPNSAANGRWIQHAKGDYIWYLCVFDCVLLAGFYSFLSFVLFVNWGAAKLCCGHRQLMSFCYSFSFAWYLLFKQSLSSFLCILTVACCCTFFVVNAVSLEFLNLEHFRFSCFVNSTWIYGVELFSVRFTF